MATDVTRPEKLRTTCGAGLLASRSATLTSWIMQAPAHLFEWRCQILNHGGRPGCKCRCDENGIAFWLPRAAHPNAKLNANCSLELQTMNYAKGHLFARARVEFSFRALVDRTIREQNREERRLAEQRATKHQFQARNSCILDGRNYRIARRLLLFPRAQF